MFSRLLYISMVLMFAGYLSISALGLQVQAPYIAGFHPLDEEPNEYSMLKAENPVLLNLQSKVFIDTAIIDFEKRQISFRRTDPLGFTLWEYHYGELSDYLMSRRNFALVNNWKHTSLDSLRAGTAKAKKNNVGKFEWEIPVQYPSWAQRVMGNEPPKLSINGFLEIKIGYGTEGNEKKGDANTTKNTPQFILDEDYEVSITGTVGRLINVNIKSNKQKAFDFSNNLDDFKIEYKETKPGELEDEIIQEVTAGATSFDMPGTSLTGYVGAKKGLFGIKIKAKLGPLALTGIASTENGGESEKKSFGRNATEASTTIKDYWQNKFFYLDTTYRRAYIRNHGKGAPATPIFAPGVDTLGVYIKADDARIKQQEGNNSIKRAYADKKDQWYSFQLLRQDVQYKLNRDEGYIQFTDSINITSSDQIAIYMRSNTDTSLNKGTYFHDAVAYGKDTLVPLLWTLKPENEIDSAGEDPARYYLMWRNVYRMTTDMSNFKLSVIRKDPGDQQDYDRARGGQYYSAILGLSDDNNKPLIDRGDIYKVQDGFFIIPPYNTESADADLPFTNPALDFQEIYMYKYSARLQPDGHVVPYSINRSMPAVGGSGGDNQYVKTVSSAGILQGTDKVWADNVELTRDVDYVINYDMGTIEYLSLRTKSAANVEVQYQSPAMFVPDKKTFLGLHGEIQLPFLSDKSFIGANVLYQKVNVVENIPRLEQEPYSKALFDFNTMIDLEPEWMTSLVNKLPFIETTAPSQASLDVEVANSRMNPNTKHEAYVDDFEDCKLTDGGLASSGESWHQASPPYPKDSLFKTPPAWNTYWFSPYDWDDQFSVPKKEIFLADPSERTSSQDTKYAVLRLHCKPAPTEPTLKGRFKNAWAGIMTPVPISFSDKTKEQYFEFLIKTYDKKGKKGKLKIQMGEMREDLSLDGGPPNGLADKEDTSVVNIDDVYKADLDLGLDRRADTSEYYMVPNDSNTGWDPPLKYNDPKLGEFIHDPSHDNYQEYREKEKENYRYKCKTQTDGHMETEDINLNGTVEVSTTERYFQYTIDLDTSTHFFDKEAKLNPDSGWKKIRIPIKDILPEKDEIGGPRWNDIRMVRLIWTDFDTSYLSEEHQLAFADMGFVGSQWVSKVDTTTDMKVEALALNSIDNSEYKSPLPDRPRDQTTNLLEREQSLQFLFHNLKKGQEGLISKTLVGQPLNLTAYKTLSLMVYGKSKSNELPGKPLYNGDIKYIFRFGLDDSTYYQYSDTIVSNWNTVSIDLQKIAHMKDFDMQRSDSAAINDSSGPLKVHAPRGRQPNLANITYMALGVVRSPSAGGGENDSGELWFDEMKVTGINEMNGWAAHAKIDTKFADLMTLSAQMDYENGDYRMMPETKRTPDDSKLTGSVSGSFNLDKFLPKDWGVSLPVSASVNSSIIRPQLRNGDVLLSQNGRSDNVTDMAGDLVRLATKNGRSGEVTESEHFEKQSVGYNVTTSYSKSSSSHNILGKVLADDISANFTYSQQNTEDHYGKKFSDTVKDTDNVVKHQTDTYTGSLKWDLTPKEQPAWTKWKPVKDDTSYKWLPKKLRDYEFSLLPTQFKFDLFKTEFTSDHIEDYKALAPINTRNFDISHAFAFDYAPIAPLCKLSYNLSINRNLDSVAADSSVWNKVDKIFSPNENGWSKMGVLYGEKSRTQTANLSIEPQIFDWWTNTMSYNTSYNASMMKRTSDPADYMSTSVSLALTINSTLDISGAFSKFGGGSSKKDSGSVGNFFSKAFKKIGFNTISFAYTANSKLKNDYLDTSLIKDFSYWDLFLYQVGAKGRSAKEFFLGDYDDVHAFGGMHYRDTADYNLFREDTRFVDRSYRFTTGLDLTVPFELHLNQISFGWSKSYEVTPLKTFLDTTITLPDLSISASTPALMKVGFIADLMSSLSLSSTFGYKKMYHQLQGDRDTTTRFDFSPLVSLDGTFKKIPITLKYSHRQSKETLDHHQTNNNTTISGDELTLNYEIEKSSRLSEIKILIWTIPIKGKTTIGLTAKRDRTDTKVDIDSKKQLMLSINPHLSYIFTDNVTGTLEYTGRHDEDAGVTKTDNTFTLTIRIQLR